MTIYYTKYGGMIHNPTAYLKLGGNLYINKYEHFKVKNYIKRYKIIRSKPKINLYIIDKASLFELQQYKKDLNSGYSYYNTYLK